MQETLAAAMPKIMAALGQFANDGEIKVQAQRWSYGERRGAGVKGQSPVGLIAMGALGK